MRFQWKAALGGLLVAAAFVSTAGAEEEWDAPTKKWIKGPASYLATDAEQKEFKKETEREAYIETFWARRDPTPGTPENEFRSRFLARVSSANKLLKERGILAGWRSEPGKVLILLGQPDDFRRSSLEQDGSSGSSGAAAPSRFDSGGGIAESGSGGSGDTSSLTLVYSDVERFGLAKKLEVEFRGDGHSYRLMTRINLGTDAIRGLDAEVLAMEFPKGAAAEEQLSLTPVAPVAEKVAAVTGSPDFTISEQILFDALDSEVGSEDIPHSMCIDFYKTLAGKTYVAITLGVDKEAVEGAESLHPVAVLRDADDPDDPGGLFLYASDDLFAPADADTGDSILRFQAGEGVPPGNYKMATGFVSDDGSRTGIQTRDLVVPNFEEAGIRLSSLTLTGHLEITSEGGGELKRPYILGNRRVIPKVQTSYGQDGVLTVYYQVYNAQEAGGSPNLRISYKVYQKRGTRFVRAAVVPPMDGVTSAVQIYELQITPAWRAGEYKLKVTVEDNLAGTFVEGEVAFQVG